MRRIVDIFLSLLLLLILSLLLIMIAFTIKLTSPGPVLYWSRRVGRNNKLFMMCKFRTMCVNAPQIATHLFREAQTYLTPVGSFLRKFSLDELPQLLNILAGDMTFVGPRPALFNQDDLVALRTEKNIQTLIPGITGWAQVNGRDELAIPLKVTYDEYYLNNRSLFLDVKILCITLRKVIMRSGVQH